MNTRSIILILIILFTVAFDSCSKDNNPVNNSSASEILPLKIGNRWTMKNTLLDSSGNVSSVDTFTVTVLRDTIIQNDKWYITTSGTWRNGKDGLYNLYFGTPILTTKFPTFVSDSITVTGNTIVTVAVNESKNVPAGSINCYHYLVKIPGVNGLQTHSFYSVGIGWVYYETAGFKNGRWVLDGRVELISYHLN